MTTAGAGGREVGRVSVRVVPSTSGFRAKLSAFLTKVEKTVKLEIPVELDTKRIGPQLARLQTQLKAATAGGVDIPVRYDESGFSDLNRSLNLTVRNMTTVNRRGGGLSRVFRMLSSAGEAAFGSVFKLAGSVFGLGDGFSKLGIRVGGVLGKFVGLAAIGSVVAGALGLVQAALLGIAGAIGAGVGALPAILASIAVPAGAAALGMEGIERAAKRLEGPFTRLKERVSAAFERGLIPAFETLRGIFPTLETGMTRVADRLSVISQRVATFLASQQGLQAIRSIFDGWHIAIGRAEGGMAKLGTELLKTAGYAPLFRVFGDIIDNLAGGFGRWLAQVRKTLGLCSPRSLHSATFSQPQGGGCVISSMPVWLF